MAFEHYIRNGTRQLRCGYTTGTCATLAAIGAVRLLLTQEMPDTLSVMTKKGILVEVTKMCYGSDTYSAWCSVKKDAGDDIDATDGMEICVTAQKSDVPGIHIDGGNGIGRVTKPGLNQAVGEVAINSAPRETITKQVEAICGLVGYDGGITLLVSAPQGEEIAKKTFNESIGICGGISIIGTSGIVEPMSEQAFIDTITLELHQASEESNRVILTPGNYGEDFIAQQGWDNYGVPCVRISNFLGEALDASVVEQYEEVLLVAHIGKLIKVAGGIMNTHSKMADGRAEIFCAHTAVVGASTQVCRAVMDATTTDACLEILKEEGLEEVVMQQVLQKIQHQLQRRVANRCHIGAVAFSNVYGLLGMTQEAEQMLKQWNR